MRAVGSHEYDDRQIAMILKFRAMGLTPWQIGMLMDKSKFAIEGKLRDLRHNPPMRIPSIDDFDFAGMTFDEKTQWLIQRRREIVDLMLHHGEIRKYDNSSHYLHQDLADRKRLCHHYGAVQLRLKQHLCVDVYPPEGPFADAHAPVDVMSK